MEENKTQEIQEKTKKEKIVHKIIKLPERPTLKNYIAGSRYGKQISEVLKTVIQTDAEKLQQSKLEEGFAFGASIYNNIIESFNYINPQNLNNKAKERYLLIQSDVRRLGQFFDYLAGYVFQKDKLIAEFLLGIKRKDFFVDFLKDIYSKEHKDIEELRTILMDGLRVALSDEEVEKKEDNSLNVETHTNTDLQPEHFE